MLRGQQEYIAVRTYCEQVMLAKERAEREREKATTSIESGVTPRGFCPPPP